MGINADDIGTARFVLADSLTTLAVQRVTQEVRPGDRLLRAEPPAALPNLEPLKPAPFITGHIIDIPKGVTQIEVLDAVTLNKGRRDGLVEGQLLTVIKAGATVRDALTGTPTPSRMSEPAPCWCFAPMKSSAMPWCSVLHGRWPCKTVSRRLIKRNK